MSSLPPTVHADTTVRSESPQWVTPRGVLWLALGLLCVAAGLALALVPPWYVVLGLCAALGGLLLFYFPYLGALAYLTFEYTRISAAYTVLQKLQLGKLLVIATLVALLLHIVVRGRFKLVWDRSLYWLLGWCVLALLSMANALDHRLALDGALDLSRWVIITILFVQLLDSLSKWQWFVWLYLLLNMKLSQFQIRSYQEGLELAGDARAHFIREGVGAGTSSFLANATDFGAAMVVVFPFALYLTLSARPRWLRWISASGVLLFTLSVLRSGSRGAALALFCVFAVYWWQTRHRLLVGAAVLLAAVSFWIAAPPEWKTRFVSASNYEEDATASSRLDFWKAGVAMCLENPVLGVGIQNFARNYLHGEGGRLIVPHSIFIEAAAELGLPGIVILCVLLWTVLRRNRDTRRLARGQPDRVRFIRGMAYALDLSLVGFVVSGAFLTILYFPHLFMILCLTLTLHYIARREAALVALPPEDSPAQA